MKPHLWVSVLLATGWLAAQARATEWDQKTVLRVNHTIQIRDTVLEPGQYVLKLYDSLAQRHVVQIFNADQSRIINTVIAIPAQRTEPAGKTVFTFWETPPGTAPALRTWFYPGETVGQEFPYPKHLTEIAMAETAPAQPPAPEANTQAGAIEPEPIPEQPPEVAENTAPAPAPPAPPAPVAEPAPPPASQQPPALPQTATLVPLFGVAGLAALGVWALLTLKRP